MILDEHKKGINFIFCFLIYLLMQGDLPLILDVDFEFFLLRQCVHNTP